MEKQKNADKGREEVKNPGNFADVLYEWSLKSFPQLQVVQQVGPLLPAGLGQPRHDVRQPRALHAEAHVQGCGPEAVVEFGDHP